MSLHIYLIDPMTRKDLFMGNITSNLAPMAEKLGIYPALFYPYQVGITKAYQMIKPLKLAITELKENPNKYSRYNQPNGWGTSLQLLSFLERYLVDCEGNKLADVSASS